MELPFFIPKGKTYALGLSPAPSWSTFDLFIVINYFQNGEHREYYETISAAHIASMPVWRVHFSDCVINSIELSTSANVFSPGQPTNICVYLARFFGNAYRQTGTLYSGPVSGCMPVQIPNLNPINSLASNGLWNESPMVPSAGPILTFQANPASGTVEVGGYAFTYTTNATVGDRYLNAGVGVPPNQSQLYLSNVAHIASKIKIYTTDAYVSQINEVVLCQSLPFSPFKYNGAKPFTIHFTGKNAADAFTNSTFYYRHYPARFGTI